MLLDCLRVRPPSGSEQRFSTTCASKWANRVFDWLRVEYAIEKPSNKLLAATELDSDTWVAEVKRIRGKKQPLSSAGLHALRDEYTRTIEPARALAAETLNLERKQVSVLTIDTNPSPALAHCGTNTPAPSSPPAPSPPKP